MSLKITHKYSTAAGTPPASGDIDVGEIAINAADAALYLKDTNGDIKNAVTDALFAQAGASAVQRSVESKLQDVVSVKDFGAKGDGVTDDGPAFQAAHDSMAAMGVKSCTLLVPAGKYLINSPVVFSAISIAVKGEGCNIGPNIINGTWIYITNSGITPFTINNPNARGSSFSYLGVMHSQPNITTGWAPTSYPYVFDIQNALGEVSVYNVHAPRCTKLIRSFNSGRLNVKNLTGQFFDACIYIDKALDVPRLENIHSWTYWTSSNDVLSYQQANLDLITLGRVDTPFIDKIFSFASRSIIHTVNTADGSPSKLICGGIVGDFSKYGLWIESSEFTAQVNTLNTQHEVWPSTGSGIAGSAAIYITTSNARIHVGTIYAERLPQEAIISSGTGTRISIGSGLFRYINQQGGAGAVKAGANTLIEFANPPLVIDSSSAPVTSPASGSNAESGIKQVLPPSAVNTLQGLASVTGSAVTLKPTGPDSNIDLRLQAAGASGSVRLLANDKTVVRLDNPNGDSTNLLARSQANSIDLITEGAGANVGINFNPKGAGAVGFGSPARLKSYTTATRPSATLFGGCLIYVSDATVGSKLQYSDGSNWVAAG